jgi:hypothetical protein
MTAFKREHRLIGKCGFEDDEVVRQLCLDEFIGHNMEDIDRQGVRKTLRHLAQQAQQNPGTVPAVLAANVKRTAQLVGLSPLESGTFEFVVLMHTYPTLLEICKRPNNLRVREIADALARLLHLPRQRSIKRCAPKPTCHAQACCNASPTACSAAWTTGWSCSAPPCQNA